MLIRDLLHSVGILQELLAAGVKGEYADLRRYGICPGALPGQAAEVQQRWKDAFQLV